MRILELCHFSKGVCGVFARVKEESQRLDEIGHEVIIMTSNIEKGTNEIVESEDKIYNVPIKRFPARKLGGESFMTWDFEEAALEFKPEVIICHSYRQPHITKALEIKEKLNCKVFLVTHAPFDRKSTRSFVQQKAVEFYDKFVGRKILPRFDKVITITRWETPFLMKLGLSEKNIEYIPNGIPEEFFN